MDTSSPAIFANGEFLRTYVGRRVRTVVQVTRPDGVAMVGQTTDGQQITVKGCRSFPVSHFVEVVGVADGAQSIQSEMCTDFGEIFDAASYNRLCQLANGDFKKFSYKKV